VAPEPRVAGQLLPGDREHDQQRERADPDPAEGDIDGMELADRHLDEQETAAPDGGEDEIGR
jgi:hypothetical protein